MRRLYIASPLFSDAEKAFNSALKNSLKAHFQVFLPQEDGILLADRLVLGENAQAVMGEIFTADLTEIKHCDVLVIVLDGRTVDEGAAFELGYAYSLGKKCYGLQTDPRRLLPAGNNPMIEHSCEAIFSSLPDLVKHIA